eukprot:TRINITY_DN7880_c0_g1_i1.p1 TRINITY_DN7880_c0_g1~~TRINITY_DN7880_c0_g1_i1.p1  ORF type:complete len:468 (-),score=74.39 TRINITY_DN7880_c0_g1_i1:240-1643(-)
MIYHRASADDGNGRIGSGSNRKVSVGGDGGNDKADGRKDATSAAKRRRAFSGGVGRGNKEGGPRSSRGRGRGGVKEKYRQNRTTRGSREHGERPGFGTEATIQHLRRRPAAAATELAATAAQADPPRRGRPPKNAAGKRDRSTGRPRGRPRFHPLSLLVAKKPAAASDLEGAGDAVDTKPSDSQETAQRHQRKTSRGSGSPAKKEDFKAKQQVPLVPVGEARGRRTNMRAKVGKPSVHKLAASIRRKRGKSSSAEPGTQKKRRKPPSTEPGTQKKRRKPPSTEPGLLVQARRGRPPKSKPEADDSAAQGADVGCSALVVHGSLAGDAAGMKPRRGRPPNSAKPEGRPATSKRKRGSTPSAEPGSAGRMKMRSQKSKVKPRKLALSGVELTEEQELRIQRAKAARAEGLAVYTTAQASGKAAEAAAKLALGTRKKSQISMNAVAKAVKAAVSVAVTEALRSRQLAPTL